MQVIPGWIMISSMVSILELERVIRLRYNENCLHSIYLLKKL